MALVEEMMQGGISAGGARGICGQINDSISAAGTTQGTATALTTSINVITTAAANSGVILPNPRGGSELDILNIGANQCIVYPPTGAQINNLSANAGFTLAPNTAVKVKKFSALRWMGFLSA